MDIDEVPLLEELMDGIGCQAADAEHGLEHIGAGPQMRHGPQKFHGVALLLHGVVAGRGTFHGDLGGLDFEGLLGIRGQQHLAFDDQGSTHVDLGNLIKIIHGVMIDHLDRGKESAVIEHDEAKLLAGPDRPNPAADSYFLARIGACVLEQLSDRNQIHRNNPLSC